MRSCYKFKIALKLINVSYRYNTSPSVFLQVIYVSSAEGYREACHCASTWTHQGASVRAESGVSTLPGVGLQRKPWVVQWNRAGVGWARELRNPGADDSTMTRTVWYKGAQWQPRLKKISTIPRKDRGMKTVNSDISATPALSGCSWVGSKWSSDGSYICLATWTSVVIALMPL